ncbi:MAG: helix-turn-helix transcriptional regulator [Planctomycetaceae bacterium]|nr:helix-turn-helix transcriptional regulator [Planctomycetaceae bacterium]
MKELNGDKLRGHLETMVLSVLEEGDAHGLEVIRRLEDRGCGLLKLKEGTLYPALYRLQDAGKVKVVREEKPSTGRGAPRRVYCLTRKGKRQLAQGRQEWVQFADLMGSIIGAPA